MALTIAQTGDGPRYQLVRQDLLARIRSGEFNPGERLPSENQICNEYGVSVTTARRALLELVNEGIVFRQAGVGTIVAAQVRQMRLTFLNIGFVGNEMRQTSTATGEMIAGVGECAWERDAFFSMTGLREDEAATYLHGLVRDRAVDGVLLRTAGNIAREYLDILEGAGMPYVVIKRHLADHAHNYVVSDEAKGGWLATTHLLERGYQRIGFVCAKPDFATSQERLAGYRQALHAQGVAVDDTIVRTDLPDFLPATGYRAVAELLGQANPPEALFIASDTLTLGGYDAIRDAGLRVGADIAVVGFDDIAAASLLQPPLTTVRTSHFDLGRLSTDLLIELIERRAVAPVQRVITPELIVRESAGERRAEAPAEITAPEPALAGRLIGRTAVIAGPDGPVRRALVRRFMAEGAWLIDREPETETGLESPRPARDSSRPWPSTVQVLVEIADLSSAMMGFDELRARGHAAAARLAEQGGGCLLLVTGLGRAAGSGEIDRAAARGGVAAILRGLATTWAKQGVRVNAILHNTVRADFGEGVEQIAGTVTFFASAEATNLDGETVVLRL